MGLIPQIWGDRLFSNPFPTNTFIVRSIDYSAFALADQVHLPNAGSDPSVTKNRSTLPATSSQRTDSVVSFSMASFSSDPIIVKNADKLQLTYDKLASATDRTRGKIIKEISEDILFSWLGGKKVDVVTSGSSVAAHTPSATGNRLAFCAADVASVMVIFDAADIPQEGRCMLIDAHMKKQLLDDLSEKESQMFLASANLQTGIVGNLYGFDIYVRSRVGVATSAGVAKAWSATGATTDLAAGIAWHEDYVCRAQGDTKIFVDEDSPAYYADIISGETFAGGSKVMSDGTGIVRILQTTYSAS
ncbi:MAG: hypothetical protein SNG45_07855 [Rikenellaceae bacterium]